MIRSIFILTAIVTLIILIPGQCNAQEHSKYIVVDQFGYLPGSKKVAVIRDPQVGFDAAESFSPGTYYSVVNATTGEQVFRAPITRWNNGETDASSGDKAWHFDFTTIDKPGTYFILDETHNLKSYDFVISHDVYNEVLKQAMRTFFYQRVGFKKDTLYAGEAWADEASHIGPLQDKNCRSFLDKTNPDTEKDLSGGWYDAGDYNKYTNWTANYIVELMKAFIEKPDAWADDYNIPESGNGVPDILDEAQWGIDHVLRMQLEDGSVISIVGESHASPPSLATGPSYYGPVSTSATMNTAAALAIGSRVYRSIGMVDYADTLLARALKAWDWAVANPEVIFNNNDPEYSSLTLGAGNQEVDDYGRSMIKLEAACYLFDVTGDTVYGDYFDAHYDDANMFAWTWAYPYEDLNQEVLLYYTTINNGTITVQDHIKSVYSNSVINSTDNMAAYTSMKDPYFAHLKDYTWGSNAIKSSQGSMNYNLITYDMSDGVLETAFEASEAYIHYIHGINPLNFVYLSNMYDYGADNGVNEFYHSWFANGSSKWDRVGVSTHGPAPGFLTGGPNPGYDWSDCCPGGCGSASSNSICTSESISPPKNQPKQKSYKDFNTSWPLNSWTISENSCGSQVRYIRLLSKFVTANRDCFGVDSGAAFIDSCGVCAGGNTGITPNDCTGATANPVGDTMYVEGRHLYTAAGERVILRGVNEMFVWSDDKTGITFIPEIAKSGANCVRLVWTEEYGNKNKLVRLIENCIANKMIAMPECHSATGEWDKLDVCVNFWKDPVLLEGVQKNKKWTLLNIGNEVGDRNVTSIQFKTGYKDAIDSLRSWGYTVPIVIDASNWGQDVDIIFDTWKEILAHDTLKNVIFSVHSYWSTTTNYNRVATESVNKGLPIIIGEGPSPTAYPNCNILDYKTGLNVTGSNDIGWLSWSWGGMSNGHCVPNFDHSTDGRFGNWETIHAVSMMADHKYSLIKTARRPASMYDDDTVRVAGIYVSAGSNKIIVGDSTKIKIMTTPVNAPNSGVSINITGDSEAASYNPGTGWLTGMSPGTVRIKPFSHENPSVTFTRIIIIEEMPVSAITIQPSHSEMFIGDTIYIDVMVFPENATFKDYFFEVTDEDAAIEFVETTGMIIARDSGTAEIKALWTHGDVEGIVTITVSDPTVSVSGTTEAIFNIYPNPNSGLLSITTNHDLPYQLMIFDLPGNRVIDNFFTNSTNINTSHLAPGYYEIIISCQDKLKRQKLIKL